MNPQRLTVKFFIQDPATVELQEFVPIFHRWIQNQSLQGLLIDVADYKHIQDGPGIVLVADRADYAIDLGNGRPGLLLRRKRPSQTERLSTQVRASILLALRAVQALENDPALRGRITFRTGEIVIGFPDRLRFPNTADTFAAVEAEILPVLQSLYPGIDLNFQPASSDPRAVFSLNVQAPSAPQVSLLIKNVEAVPIPI